MAIDFVVLAPCSMTPCAITTSGRVEPAIESLVRGEYVPAIAAGSDGNMWFAEQEPAEPTVAGHQAIGLLGVGAPAAPQASPTVAGSGQAGTPLTCQGATWSPWAGPEPSLVKLRKTTGKGRKRKTRTVPTKIAGASFSGLPVGVHRVKLKLGPTGRALLRHDGYKLAGTASARYLSSGSTHALATGAVVLRSCSGARSSRRGSSDAAAQRCFCT
jgi:hypothetical protein